MRGLGDVVERVAKITGASSVVKAVVGDDCGCAARRDALNRMFPFNKLEDGKDSSVATVRRQK